MTDKLNQYVLLSALFLIVFGVKALTISEYGSVVPYWDQWGGEAVAVYLPYLDGKLSLSHLVSSHNEHRIFFSRLLSLAELLAAGEWNPILQMVTNAALHSFAVVLLTWAFMQHMSEEYRIPAVVLSAITFSLPIAYENVLAGFQSAFYFLLLFATASFIIVARVRLFPIWLAFVAAIAAYFSLASGALVFFIAASIMAMRAASLRSIDRHELLAIIVFLIGGVVCVMFTPETVKHEALKAHSFMEFFSPLVWLGGYPFSTMISVNAPMIIRCLLFILAITPMVALLIFAIRRRPDSPGVWFALAVAMFIGLQVLSLSYGRAQGFRPSRYHDILLLVLPTSFAALSLLGLRRGFVAAWMFGAILSTVCFGLTTSIAAMEHYKYLTDRQLENVKAFVATGDISTLQNKPAKEIPLRDPDQLARLLSRQKVRAMLPSELRPPDQSPPRVRAVLFQHPRRYAFITWVKNGILTRAALIVAVGIGLLFVGMIRCGSDARRSAGPTYGR